MGQPGMQQDVLLIAGHAGVFTRRTSSEAALRFVCFFSEVLRALSARSLCDTSMLPLLDTLARLLPRLLMPFTERMTKTIDLWKRTCAKEGRAEANEELLRAQQPEDAKMLSSLVQVTPRWDPTLTPHWDPTLTPHWDPALRVTSR